MSTLARAIVAMTPRELNAFVLGLLAASPRVGDETITKLADAALTEGGAGG